MVECGIPGHITGLYIFAVVNLCALLNISLVSAKVIVVSVTLEAVEKKLFLKVMNGQCKL